MLQNFTLGQRIAIVRKRAGFKSQEALADAMSDRITRGMISTYEADKAMPTIEFLKEFVLLCQSTYEEVLDGRSPVATDTEEPGLDQLLSSLDPSTGQLIRNYIERLRKSHQKQLQAIRDKILRSLE